MAVDPADARRPVCRAEGLRPQRQRIGVVEDYQGSSRIFLR